MLLQMLAIGFAFATIGIAVSAVRGAVRVSACCPTPDADQRLSAAFLPKPGHPQPTD